MCFGGVDRERAVMAPATWGKWDPCRLLPRLGLRKEVDPAASTLCTTLETTDLEQYQPGALVTDPSQEWEIRNIIGRKMAGRRSWWMGLLHDFNTTQGGSKDGQGKRPLMQGQH